MTVELMYGMAASDGSFQFTVRRDQVPPGLLAAGEVPRMCRYRSGVHSPSALPIGAGAGPEGAGQGREAA